MLNTDNAKVEAATARLQKLKGTYVNRHAEAIARAAVSAANDEAAGEAVRVIVGHTTVGDNNAVRWAHVARRAAGC